MKMCVSVYPPHPHIGGEAVEADKAHKDFPKKAKFIGVPPHACPPKGASLFPCEAELHTCFAKAKPTY